MDTNVERVSMFVHYRAVLGAVQPADLICMQMYYSRYISHVDASAYAEVKDINGLSIPVAME